MTRRGVRVCSWVLTLGGLILLTFAVRALPGCGGPLAELRWLLDRPQVPAATYRRAADILRAAEERRPGARPALLAHLLDDPAPQPVRAGLTLLGDLLHATQAAHPERTALCHAFNAWFAARTTAEKIAFLPQSLLCAVETASTRVIPDAPLVVITPRLPDWPDFPPAEQERWLLAATLTRDEQARQLAFFLLFEPGPPEPVRIAHRLHVLDGLLAHKHPDPLTPDAPLSRLTAAQLGAGLRVPPARLVELLDDPLPEVREAAGRILALAGDERGLPALGAWVRAHGPVPPAAARLLVDLYGADWRKQLESRSSTRTAGPGDGE